MDVLDWIESVNESLSRRRNAHALKESSDQIRGQLRQAEGIGVIDLYTWNGSIDAQAAACHQLAVSRLDQRFQRRWGGAVPSGCLALDAPAKPSHKKASHKKARKKARRGSSRAFFILSPRCAAVRPSPESPQHIHTPEPYTPLQPYHIHKAPRSSNASLLALCRPRRPRPRTRGH
jgi:hypothetical protein